MMTFSTSEMENLNIKISNPRKIFSTAINRIISIFIFGTLLGTVLPLGKLIGPIRVFSFDVFFLPLCYLISILPSYKFVKIQWGIEEKFLLLMFIFLFSGVLFSVEPIHSFNVFLMWLRILIFYFIIRYCLFINIIQTKTLEFMYIVLGIFLFSVGIIQIVTGSDIGLVANYFGEDTNQAPAFLDHARVSGTSDNSNVYGEWLVTLSLALNCKLLFNRKLFPRICFFLALIVESLVMLATLSRGSVLFYGVANLLLLLIWANSARTKRLKRNIMFFSLLSLITVSALYFLNQFSLLFYLLERFHKNVDYQRIATLTYGIELLSYPKVLLTGTGIGAFYPTLAHYQIGFGAVSDWKNFSQSTSGIHNAFGMLLVEGGVFSATFFSCGYFLLIRRAFKLMQRSDHAPLTVYLCVILIAFLVPMQVANEPTSPWLLFFIAGIIAMTEHLSICCANPLDCYFFPRVAHLRKKDGNLIKQLAAGNNSEVPKITESNPRKSGF
jgi:O-antigen ligase